MESTRENDSDATYHQEKSHNAPSIKQTTKIGVLNHDNFIKIKKRLKENHVRKEKDLAQKTVSEMSKRIVMMTKRWLERSRIKKRNYEKELQRRNYEMILERERQQILVIKAQSLVRGFIERQRIKLMIECSIVIQKHWRGKLGREYFLNALRAKATLNVQRIARGFIHGRLIARNERYRIKHFQTMNNAASKVSL